MHFQNELKSFEHSSSSNVFNSKKIYRVIDTEARPANCNAPLKKFKRAGSLTDEAREVKSV